MKGYQSDFGVTKQVLPPFPNLPMNSPSNFGFGSPMRSTGPPKITTHTFQAPGGLGTRTIVEEPFEIDQPPHYEKVRSIVHRPISIPQPPETHIYEEIINVPVLIQPQPEKRIIREVYEKPVFIPQPPERQIVRELFQKPVLYQPPPERHIVHDVVRKNFLVPQPPKSLIMRKEYNEPPVLFEEGIQPNEGIRHNPVGIPMMPSYSNIMNQAQSIPPSNPAFRGQFFGSPRLVSSKII